MLNGVYAKTYPPQPFDRRETIAIAALVRAAIDAASHSGEWVKVNTSQA